jgi:hypothetical protein
VALRGSNDQPSANMASCFGRSPFALEGDVLAQNLLTKVLGAVRGTNSPCVSDGTDMQDLDCLYPPPPR